MSHKYVSNSHFSVPQQKELGDYVRQTKWLLKLILVLELVFHMRKLVQKENDLPKILWLN